jgi:uncharacterized cupredoxin-like copper-binding protein
MKGMLIGAVVIGAIAVSGASALASGPQTVERTALLVRVNVTASDTNCVVSKKTAGRGIVVFKVTNVGKVGHAFEINRRKTRALSHGKSATLRVVFLRKGHYAYQCTTNGHATARMKGVFTIT